MLKKQLYYLHLLCKLATWKLFYNPLLAHSLLGLQPIVIYGKICYYIVFYGTKGYFMILYGAVCYCMLGGVFIKALALATWNGIAVKAVKVRLPRTLSKSRYDTWSDDASYMDSRHPWLGIELNTHSYLSTRKVVRHMAALFLVRAEGPQCESSNWNDK